MVASLLLFVHGNKEVERRRVYGTETKGRGKYEVVWEGGQVASLSAEEEQIGGVDDEEKDVVEDEEKEGIQLIGSGGLKT